MGLDVSALPGLFRFRLTYMLKTKRKIFSKNKLLDGLIMVLILVVAVTILPIEVRASHTTEHTILQLQEQIKALQNQIQTANAPATSTPFSIFIKTSESLLSFSFLEIESILFIDVPK